MHCSKTELGNHASWNRPDPPAPCNRVNFLTASAYPERIEDFPFRRVFTTRARDIVAERAEDFSASPSLVFQTSERAIGGAKLIRLDPKVLEHAHVEIAERWWIIGIKG